MVVPLIPIIAVGAAGVLGTIAGSIFGGGSKKQGVTETHATQEHYAPTITDARSTSQVFSPTYQYQISSPDASMVSKKTATATATSDPTVSPSRTQEGGAGISSMEGVDMTKIALIGGAALIGYGIVKEVL